MSDTPNEGQRALSPGTGRRSSRPGPGETILHVCVTLAQRQKFAQLGGTQWLCRMIDAAPHMPKVYTGEDRIMAMLMRFPDPFATRRQPPIDRN